MRAAQSRGHRVTIFNRGRTRPGLFPEVEKLVGNRDPNQDTGLEALRNRGWNVVFDDSGYVPRHVQASAELLAPSVELYVYVSSVSCYARNDEPGATEAAAVATLADPTVETMGAQMQNYGALKALCEQAAERALPGRTARVRPGFIVGPEDASGRFTYWPVRFARGGDVLVPGDPRDPLQVIDVRDLAAWMILLGERNITGVYNACGPVRRLAWGELIAACQRNALRVDARNDARSHWASAAALDGARTAFDAFPIWLPPTGETRGFHQRSNAAAVAAGLQCRAIDETVHDTLAWWQSAPADHPGRKLAGPSAEQERSVLRELQLV